MGFEQMAHYNEGVSPRVSPRTRKVINTVAVAHAASLFNREIELEEDSARVSYYETQLLIGQSNGVVQNSKGLFQKHI